MRKKINFHLICSIMLAVLMSIAFIACDNDKSNGDEISQPQDYLVGQWQCKLDAYGDPWDEPLIMQFDADGSGYYWFSDEPFSERYEFDYVATSSKIKMWEEEDGYQYHYDLRYEMSSNGKNLTIYDFDDDDMEVLKFVRIK